MFPGFKWAAAALFLLGGLAQGAPDTKAARASLARQTTGLKMVFMEAQRAGMKPADGDSIAPHIWAWKKPAFTSPCQTLLKSLTPAEQQAANLPKYASFFEAGSSVIITGPMAYAVVQQALGAILYANSVAGPAEAAVAADGGNCLPPAFREKSVKEHVRRQLWHAGQSLASTIVHWNAADPLDYKQIISIGDESTYLEGTPSWGQPPTVQDLCYVATGDKPAADIAAQTAAALAMTAKYFKDTSAISNGGTTDRLATHAMAAYNYAVAAFNKYGSGATCGNSAAAKNCISSPGNCDTSIKGPCELYPNSKEAKQQLFAAAAALYYLTGDTKYRRDVDKWWQTEELFKNNWNSVYPQGLTILALTPNPGKYADYLKESVQKWVDCSSGQKTDLCEVTPGGSAYSRKEPWGNIGMSLQAVCSAGIYAKLNPGDKGAACFIKRQLGFVTNHKCAGGEGKCNTPTPEGFSYMVGLGKSYPTHIHNRDVALQNFYTPEKPDINTLCGGIVSGPWTNPPGSTDVYKDNRNMWTETEAGLDYAGSVLCAFGGYAALPDATLSGCTARSPFDGR